MEFTVPAHVHGLVGRVRKFFSDSLIVQFTNSVQFKRSSNGSFVTMTPDDESFNELFDVLDSFEGVDAEREEDDDELKELIKLERKTSNVPKKQKQKLRVIIIDTNTVKLLGYKVEKIYDTCLQTKRPVSICYVIAT